MKEIKDLLFDCDPTPLDPSTKKRFLDVRFSQGKQIVAEYQRGIIDSEGEFVPISLHSMAIHGDAAVVLTEQISAALETALTEVNKASERTGASMADQRRAALALRDSQRVIEEPPNIVKEPQQEEPAK